MIFFWLDSISVRCKSSHNSWRGCFCHPDFLVLLAIAAIYRVLGTLLSDLTSATAFRWKEYPTLQLEKDDLSGVSVWTSVHEANRFPGNAGVSLKSLPSTAVLDISS